MGESFLFALSLVFPILFFIGGALTVWATSDTHRPDSPSDASPILGGDKVSGTKVVKP